MARFRSNHSSPGSKGIPFLFKIVIYGVILIVFLLKLLKFFKAYELKQREMPVIESTKTIPINNKVGTTGIDLPNQSTQAILVKHQYFTLSYSEPNEQAEWVSYTLTRDQLNLPKVGRFDYFSPDYSIKTKSALHRDYTGSGYTRGHLAPAADMAFDQKAEEECFFMSNISPQDKYFNQGIWRELEESIRDWARQYKSLIIVTGPVLSQGIIKKIGENRVSVPSYFYKVVLDTLSEHQKGVGFIIKNSISDQPLETYMVTIDSVETLTKLDFFNAINKNQKIEKTEHDFNKTDWPFRSDRFHKRVEGWNKN
ncbi:MAG: DNA/RNA non-specific endonuclease [Saprospiraceae bacterium]